MSEPANTETETNSTIEPVKKGSKKMSFIILAVLLLAGTAGGGFFYLKSSAKTNEAAEMNAKDKKSRSKKAQAETGEEETAKPDAKPAKGENAKIENAKIEAAKPPDALKNAIPDDENVKHIVELQPFIVNLADVDQARYLRMSVSLGVGGEEASEKPDPIFITRVRNAMLAVLSAKSSEEVLTADGKAKLRRELLNAAQTASEEPAVEAIYITDFIVQL